MSKENVPYLTNYMNKLIINPLAEIRDLITIGDFERALNAERGVISSLPPKTRDSFDMTINKIEGLLSESNKFSAVDPVQFSLTRKKYMKQEGGKMARNIFDLILKSLHETQLFEFLKSYGPDLGKLEREKTEEL